MRWPLSRLTWSLLAALGFFLFLLLHKSQHPQILGRYSVVFFVFLCVYAGLLAGVVLLTRSSGWERLKANILSEKAFFDFCARNHLRLFLGCILIHLLFVLAFISPAHLFSTQPILYGDYAHHYHQVKSVADAVVSSGEHWAYDPSFAAGYPLGTIFDVDMKLFEVVGVALSSLGVPLGLVFNICIFLVFALVPILVHATCRNFSISKNKTLAVVIASVLLWHSHQQLVGFNEMGICSFVFGVYWAFLCASALHRYSTKGHWGRALLFFLALATGFLVHITAPILMLAPVGAVYLTGFRARSAARHVVILVAVTAAVAVNYWWIRTVIEFLPLRVETTFWNAPGALQLFKLLVRPSQPDLILGALGVWGFYLALSRNRAFALMGLTSTIFYFALSTLAASIPVVKTLEPLRFVVPFAVISMIGFTWGAVSRLSESTISREKLRRAFPWLLILGFLMLTVLAPRTIVGRGFGQPTPSISDIVKWIELNTDSSARIAFLDRSPGQLTGARLGHGVRRQFIGGPFSQMNLRHAYASFTQFRFIDKRLPELTPEYVSRSAELFNIRWIITTNEYACSTFSNFSKVINLETSFTIQTGRAGPGTIETSSESPSHRYQHGAYANKVCIFRVKETSDFFMKGSGDIRAKLNRLEVTNASPGGVVLKYHWLDTLAVDPPMPIRKKPVEGSPVGFIEIENGDVSEFVVYNGY